jgi:hypothetical protein
LNELTRAGEGRWGTDEQVLLGKVAVDGDLGKGDGRVSRREYRSYMSI